VAKFPVEEEHNTILFAQDEAIGTLYIKPDDAIGELPDKFNGLVKIVGEMTK
jgi:hypothetical protein